MKFSAGLRMTSSQSGSTSMHVVFRTSATQCRRFISASTRQLLKWEEQHRRVHNSLTRPDTIVFLTAWRASFSTHLKVILLPAFSGSAPFALVQLNPYEM